MEYKTRARLTYKQGEYLFKINNNKIVHSVKMFIHNYGSQVKTKARGKRGNGWARGGHSRERESGLLLLTES